MKEDDASGLAKILWERHAVKKLQALPRRARERVVASVERLRAKPMAGSALSGDWKGLRRLRVGSCRVIYRFDGDRILLIMVLRVAHRRSAHRR